MPSMVLPASGEPVEATKRLSMHEARRKRILARHGNVCAYPECEVATGLEVDHIVCLELGGKDVDGNCEGLCEAHHAAKTRRDIKLIAKARRIRKALAGEGRIKRPILSRRFDKTLSKKFSGEVVRR